MTKVTKLQPTPLFHIHNLISQCGTHYLICHSMDALQSGYTILWLSPHAQVPWLPNGMNSWLESDAIIPPAVLGTPRLCPRTVVHQCPSAVTTLGEGGRKGIQVNIYAFAGIPVLIYMMLRIES